jgi:short-subunit dehydrogenase
MSTDKNLVLITGGKHQLQSSPTNNLTNTPKANSGIGLEWASQLMAKGPYHILIGARSVEKGVYFVTQAFRPLLLKARGTARVINVSSGMGSVGLKLDHSQWTASIASLPYRASKAALHMVTAELIYEFKDEGNVKFFAVCPGFTVSNLGPYNKLENGAKATDEAVKPLLRIVEGERDGEANGFLHADGQYPW